MICGKTILINSKFKLRNMKGKYKSSWDKLKKYKMSIQKLNIHCKIKLFRTIYFIKKKKN